MDMTVTCLALHTRGVGLISVMFKYFSPLGRTGLVKNGSRHNELNDQAHSMLIEK